MKKRMMVGLLIAVMAVIALTGCNDKKSGVKKADIDSKDDITYEAVYEANKGSTLMEYYDNVQYVYEIGKDKDVETQVWTLLKEDGEYSICQESTIGETMVYKNGTCYYQEYDEYAGTYDYAKGWFMEGVYEDYMQACVDSFLIEEGSEEEISSIEEKDDAYVIWSLVNTIEGQENYYRYTVDKESLIIQTFEAVIKYTAEDAEVDEEVVAKSVITPNAEYEEPAYVEELEKAAHTRTVTIMIDNEKEEKVELPAQATLLGALSDGYALYEDEEQLVEFDDTLTELDDNGYYKDVTVYCLKDE